MVDRPEVDLARSGIEDEAPDRAEGQRLAEHPGSEREAARQPASRAPIGEAQAEGGREEERVSDVPDARVRAAQETLAAAGLGAQAKALWGERELLRAIDEILTGRPSTPAADDPLILAAAIALAGVLVRELTLEWVEEAGTTGAEPRLCFAGSEVTLYPLRMVAAHLAGAERDRTPVRVERLVRSTGAYLDHLVRYFPSRLGLERRSRGARRPRRDGSA